MRYVRDCLKSLPALLAIALTAGDMAARQGIIPTQPRSGLATSGWPKDRGDAANTGRAAVGKGAKGKLLWVSKVAGRGNPVTGAGGIVYVGGTNFVYSLDPKTGRENIGFEAATRKIIQDIPRPQRNVGGYTTAAVGRGGVVYVDFESGDGATPINEVFALDGATGEKIWGFKTGDLLSPPAVGSDGTVYVCSWDHCVYALDGATGARKWRFQTGDFVETTPALGPDGTLYVGARDTFVYALDARTGKLRWKFAAGDVIYSCVAVGRASLAYVAAKNGYVYALAARTGRKAWEAKTPGGVFNSPALGNDGTVYIVSDAVYALDGGTGSRKWTFRLRHGASSGFQSVVLSGDGMVYVAWDKLYALSGATGKVRWAFNAHSPVAAPAVGADGTLYFGSANGKVYAVR